LTSLSAVVPFVLLLAFISSFLVAKMQEVGTTQNNDVPDTKGMVRKLEETMGVAVGTLEKLHEQGEQMGRIIDMNNEHTDVLYEAKQQTRQLSFTGRISNLFRKKKGAQHTAHPQLSHEVPKDKKDKEREKQEKKEKKEKKKEAEEELSPEDKMWKERADPTSGPKGNHPEGLSDSQLAMVQEQDRDLDQMSIMLSSIKEMTQITAVELNNQTKQIDVMDEQIEKNNNSTKKTTAKLASKYGKA